MRSLIIGAVSLLVVAVGASAAPRLPLRELVTATTKMADQIFQGSSPTASGQVACATGANVATWQTPASCGISSGGTVDAGPPDRCWTIIDCDFTTQAGQAIAADGAYTICGRAWQKYNTANELTGAAIMPDGGGWFCEAKASPTSTSFTTNNTRTGPLIDTNVLAASALFTLATPIEVEFYDGSPSAPIAASQGTVVGLDVPDAGSQSDVARVFRAWTGTAAGFQLLYGVPGSSTLANNQTGVPAFSTNPVVEGVFNTGLTGSINAAFAGGYGAGDWPADSSLFEYAMVGTTQSTNTGPFQSLSASQVTLMVGCQNGTAVTPYVSIVKRVRVRVRN